MTGIDLVLIHFRTVGLAHLDAACVTVAQQDLTEVRSLIVLDNNSLDEPDDVIAVLDRYPMPVPRLLVFCKHGNPARTQSWSTNRAMETTVSPWVFMTRSDFLLDPHCLRRFREARDAHPQGWDGMVTSFCHQMGYDAQLSNTDALAPYSLPDAPWRRDPQGARSLIGCVPANYFQTTDADAGVWLLRRFRWIQVGGMNERMAHWGYQTQEFMRCLRAAGTAIENIHDYLYHHQHHYSVRDFAVAAREGRFARR